MKLGGHHMSVRPRRLTGAERRIQLMDVARAAFARGGYEATPIEEIAREAGVSKPVVYEHFGSKEGLHAATVEREMDRLIERVSLGMAEGTARQRFEGAVLAFLRYVEEEPSGFLALTRDSPTTSAATRPNITRVIDDLAARVGDVFDEQFRVAGYDPSLSPLFANALVGMVTQVGQWWAQEPRRGTLAIEAVAQHVTALGWLGLRALPAPAKKVRARGKAKAAGERAGGPKKSSG
jgi:AcrR family transcriptional regulator